MFPASLMEWLLDSDPAIRWQVMRDLAGETGAAVAAERSRVASEGWGAELLARQASGGYWGAADDDGWMTTMDALAMLREFGADPRHRKVRTAVQRVRDHLVFGSHGNRPFFDGEVEACINGAILASSAYFGVASEPLVRQLLNEQLQDGGWNCEAPASKRSSFHSTLRVLEGLLEYEQAQGAAPTVTAARLRAHEYLLERRLLRSLRTGELIDPGWTLFAYPTLWHYDALRALDYLRAAGAAPDPRMAEAVELVEMRRGPDGRWALNLVHPSRVGMVMEPGPGHPSRWNTLRALRVLEWYRAGTSEPV